MDHIRERLLKKGVSETAAQIIKVQDEKVQSQITIPPGECGVAGAINNMLMHLDVMQ